MTHQINIQDLVGNSEIKQTFASSSEYGKIKTLDAIIHLTIVEDGMSHTFTDFRVIVNSQEKFSTFNFSEAIKSYNSF